MENYLEPFYQFIKEKLKIEPNAKIEKDYRITIGNRELLIDMAIYSKGTLTLVEIKSIVNEESIYRLYSLSHLINSKQLEGNKIRLVCAGKSMKYSTRELSTELGIEILLIPGKVYNFMAQTRIESEGYNFSSTRPVSSPYKISSQKAWKIICSVLMEKPSSILAISKKTGISYGWTNSVIHKLIYSGILSHDFVLKIMDVNKLLNVISWERPLEDLLVETINTNFKTAGECINEIALNLNKLGIDYAFTAHSSSVYYGSSIIREDTAYVYLPNPVDAKFIRSFSAEKGSCRLNIYAPDRNIMGSSEIIEGVRIVDVCQNLLDLAGLGIDGRGSAKELERKIGE